MLYTPATLADALSPRRKLAVRALVALLAHHTSVVAAAAIVSSIRMKGWHPYVTHKWGRRRGRIAPRRVPLDWDEYMSRPHMTPKRFLRLFRMRKEAFDKLVWLLEKYWEEQRKARPGRSKGPRSRIAPALHLAMTLRYLGGGQAIDISEMYNVWDATFYNCLKRTLEALGAILPKWPLVAALDAETEAPLRALSEGFRARSHRAMHGAIGAIDGLLVPIKAPSGETNAKTYHCRKGFFAINIQGICDARYRITYASIGRTPGAVHDSYAWSRDPLHKRIHGEGPTNSMLMRYGYYLIGDDAYRTSHTLAAPWPGKWGADSPQCCYNYNHSSARIAVEQTFGMLCRKWLVLKRPFEGNLRRTKRCAGIHQTIHACMKLVCLPPPPLPIASAPHSGPPCALNTSHASLRSTTTSSMRGTVSSTTSTRTTGSGFETRRCHLPRGAATVRSTTGAASGRWILGQCT